jgi:hypothetical protein
VKFEDVWTDAATAGRPTDLPFSYQYSNLTTPSPTSAECGTTWNATCRITIHYEQHIHPLWALPRVSLAADGVTVLADNTCTRCHAPLNAANQAQVPAGQLDLTDGPSDEVALQFKAYRELLFTDNAQEVNMGALQDIGANLDPPQTVPVAPSMRVLNARGSTQFFTRFAPGGSHAGYLSTAELRLLSEWLDIGAQYYNDPFLAPED